MTKRNLYKSGRKNPNAYKKGGKYLYGGIVALLAVIICLTVTGLDRLGVVSWGELYGKAGIVDGASPTQADFAAYYLDAGQSDCTIIICDTEVMLIDTGTYNQLGTIKSSLRTLGIDGIDYMVITHPHDDHMGSAAELMKAYKVNNIIMPRLSSSNMVTTLAYEELLDTVDSMGVNAIAAEPNSEFRLGGAKFRILAPLEQDEELNNMSVVLKITHGENSFLFQGDAEKKVENALLNEGYDLSADILKAGHHGSNTSSTDKFIKAVAPDGAVLSCGAGNSYGHPHPDTLETLEKNGVDAFATPVTGDITAKSDGKSIIVTFEKIDEAIVYE